MTKFSSTPKAYLIYRGAMYRKAANPKLAPKDTVLDKQVMRAVWRALKPKVQKFASFLQSNIIDDTLSKANKYLTQEFKNFSVAVSEELFDDVLAELDAGTGGVDIATKKKVADMHTALQFAIRDQKITPTVLLELFGWAPPRIKPIVYKDMAAYFDPATQEGNAYLKEVMKRLEPLL